MEARMTTTAPPIRVEQFLAAAAQRYPERIALLYGARTWTYAALVAEARRRARVLHAAGLPPGTTVIAIEPMSDDLVFALLVPRPS